MAIKGNPFASSPGMKHGPIGTLLLLAISTSFMYYKYFPQEPFHPEEVTVVTWYIELPTFQKHDKERAIRRGPSDYREWMKIWGKIKNPVVAYFASHKMEKEFLETRAKQPENRTRTFILDQNESWAFSFKPRIEKIISSNTFPKFHPNTVVPDYNCAVHAKYEVLAKAVQMNPYKTKFMAWADFGFFRYQINPDYQEFFLQLPPDFDKEKIAYCSIKPLRNYTSEEIFKQNINFIAGGYFVGKTANLLFWATLYRQSMIHYLEEGLIGADEQVLYSMILDNKIALHKLQPYPTKYGTEHRYVYLGYLSRREDPQTKNKT